MLAGPLPLSVALALVATLHVRPPRLVARVEADSGRAIVAAPVDRAPVVDGRLDDAAWGEAAPTTDFVQFEPRSGAPATERTEVRIVYDRAALYVGVRLHDTRPDSIVARLGRRDADVFSDWFTVLIDSYHDRRTAFTMSVNPRGVQADARVSNDTLRDGNWDAVWSARTHVDSLGWTAELRIPLSQLRFGASSDPTAEEVWGINFERYLARRDERSYWAPIARGAGRLVSSFGELRGLRGLRAPRQIELAPYVVGRAARGPGAPGALGAAARPEHTASGTVGADLRYRPRSDLTLSATLNPDFGQVEADPAVVNLSVYETFFPEKRPFFTEGADLFRFDQAGVQLFYSRRIGGTPPRAVVAPDGADAAPAGRVVGAAKLSGRTANGWSVGALGALTRASLATVRDSLGRRTSEPVDPLTTYVVTRVGRTSPDGQRAVDLVLTATERQLDASQSARLHSGAYVGGMTFRRRFAGGAYEVAGSALGSATRGSTGAIATLQTAPGRYFQRPDAPHLRVDSTRTALAGAAGSLAVTRVGGAHWSWELAGHAVAPGFEVNDLGYQRSADVAYESVSATYGAYEPGRLVRSWDANVNEWGGWTFGGERTTTGVGGSMDVELVNHWGASVGVTRGLRATSTDALRGGPALATAPRTDGWLNAYTDARRALGAQLYASASRDAEGGTHAVGGGVSLDWRPTPGAELSAGPYLWHGVDAAQPLDVQLVGDTPHYLLARVAQSSVSLAVRANVAFAPTLSLQLYAQPFVAEGAYSAVKEVRRPRARDFDERFHTFAGAEIARDATAGGYQVDLDGDGERTAFVWDPSFSTKSLSSTTVLRWEYRPGSTLYVVWALGRSEYLAGGRLRVARDVGRLFEPRFDPSLPTTNVLEVKASYWLGR